MRCFVSIDIPEKIKKEIIEIQKKLPAFKGKITEPENLHLTLKFLGEIDKSQLDQITKILEKAYFRKFNVRVGSLGVFSPKNIKIVWLHIDDCTNLHDEIDKSLKRFFPLETRFMSHLTIARVKDIDNPKKFLENLKSIKIPQMEFTVDQFYLKQSILTEEKPQYKTLAVYPLR